MEKLKTGIFGLNSLIYGGINEHSSTVVIGAAGTGKTTFALQFIMRGLADGQTCIFISLDENKEQILREACAKGWDYIRSYVETERLVFIDVSGRKFVDFIRDELPPFVQSYKGTRARIVIDPLTPVIWAIPNRYEQRELLSLLIKDLKMIGTAVFTLEEHSTFGTLQGEEIVIPMYLADCVIHMKHSLNPAPSGLGTLKIIKCRDSRHERGEHPYTILKGLGIVISDDIPEKRETNQIAGKLRNDLQKRRTSFSVPILDRLEKILSMLKDDDFAGLKEDVVLRWIVEEYGE